VKGRSEPGQTAKRQSSKPVRTAKLQHSEPSMTAKSQRGEPDLTTKSRHSEPARAANRRRAITLAITALALIASGISFVMMLSRIPNMHIIFYLVLGVSILVVTFLALWALGAHEKSKRLAKVLRRCLLICLSVGLSGFLILQGLIISSARTEDAEVDALIVLGAGLRNSSPSMILRTRLNAAIRYLEAQDDIPVIVSGGLGRGETITEAEAMFRYLSSRGVDESLIWKEETSTSTRENLAFSLALMEENGLDLENATVAIVSNEFHLYRAKLIAGKAGVEAVGVAAQTPGANLRALYFFREAFALANEVLL